MPKNDTGKISASAALSVFVVGVIAILGAATLLIVRPGLNKSDTSVQADTIPFAARLDRVDGDIGIARQTGTQLEEQYQGWTKATVNAPVSLGDRIYVSDGSKASFAINRNNYVRLNPSTSLDVVALSEGHTQLALREGACVFDVGALDSGETYEVGTPNGAVDFTQPGLYQVGIDDGGDTVVSVLNGQAEVSCLAGSGEVSKGQLLTLVAAETAEAIVSDLSPNVAGTIVSDYYSYRYPKVYDGRYSDYHRYQADPNYYEVSYRRSASYQYIPEDAEIAGVEDLDDYGEWQDVPDYGHCWRPRVESSDWAPYRDGYWSDDHTLGLTWVSNEQWGWAPYHYGRWARVNQQWYWVPKDIKRHTAYAPSLVAFVSPRADEVGWVPLGPGDAYVPRYYDKDDRPRYAGSRADIDRYVNATSVVNYRDSGAVTVVSINQFTKVITPSSVSRIDPASYRHSRLYGDPYAVPLVRQIARTIEASRPVVAVPLQSQQSFNRPVMMRRPPVVPSTDSNVAETLKIHRVPESAVAQKMKLKRTDEAVTATQANGIPDVPPEAKLQTTRDREARMNALSAQAAEGNKAARREMRQLAQQQQVADQQRKAAEQQAVAQQQQLTEQQKAQKRAERQQAQQAAQQAAQQSQAQAAQQGEQAKAQKRADRQQPHRQSQAQTAQQVEQQKAQKRAERQQAQAQAQQTSQQAQQAAQQAEQQKAQKRAAREQAQQAAQQAAQQQAQQAAARQQAQQEQRRIQKQAQQQAQQKAQAPAQPPQQQQDGSQSNPTKAEKRAEKAKNKNSKQ